jgi:hypothetical protein
MDAPKALHAFEGLENSFTNFERATQIERPVEICGGSWALSRCKLRMSGARVTPNLVNCFDIKKKREVGTSRKASEAFRKWMDRSRQPSLRLGLSNGRLR